jgi:hypothetical protein
MTCSLQLHAVCVCLHKHLLKKGGGGRVGRGLKNLGPTAVPVSYKNQKIAWMVSEIVRAQFFKMNFRFVQHFP